MKKETLQSIILGTAGGLVFALGMCMCLVEEWRLFTPGVVAIVIGLVVLLALAYLYRKAHPRQPREPFDRGVLASVVAGTFGMLALGIGMSLMLVAGAGSRASMLGGMALGVVGLLVCVLNYPVFAYKRKGSEE